MSSFEEKRVFWLGLLALPMAACAGSDHLASSDGSAAGGSNVASAGTKGATTLGPTTTFTNQLLLEAPDDPSRCLPIPLPLDQAAKPTCVITTAQRAAECGCSELGLAPTTQALTDNGRQQLQSQGYCGDASGVACSEYCFCEIEPAVGDSLADCETAQNPAESSSGWCYVSAERGSAQAALLASCPDNQKQRVRLLGNALISLPGPSFITCTASGPAIAAAGLGEPCVAEEEYLPDFPGFNVKEISINDRAPSCSSSFCIQNHFQGRASCPYGQHEAGAAGCVVPGIATPVSVAVNPQLSGRQAAEASICSCHCAGDGPGPFCTCPDSMQCEHLIDDVGLSPPGPDLSGSYCIPRGTAYDSSQVSSACIEPNCGDAHPQ